jgi:hypothetical protein
MRYGGRCPIFEHFVGPIPLREGAFVEASVVLHLCVI